MKNGKNLVEIAKYHPRSRKRSKVGRNAGQRQPKHLHSIRRNFWIFACLGPAVVALLCFVGLPIIVAFILSLHEWSFISPVKPFIGLRNYTDMFQDRVFWNALRNTLVYTVWTVPLGIVLALLLASLVTNSGLLRDVHRAIFFAPAITTLVAVSIVWMWIFQPQQGLANQLLRSLGIPPLQWLASRKQAMAALVILSIWQSLGYNVLLFMSGLGNISRELYESAEIEGARGFTLFRYITLPLLSPTTLFITVISIINSFKVFTQVQVMTFGGPVRSTEVLVFRIWEEGFTNFRMGYASAMALLLFAIVFVLTVLQFRLGEKRVHYQ